MIDDVAFNLWSSWNFANRGYNLKMQSNSGFVKIHIQLKKKKKPENLGKFYFGPLI